jgi:hypothetical protein
MLLGHPFLIDLTSIAVTLIFLCKLIQKIQSTVEKNYFHFGINLRNFSGEKLICLQIPLSEILI